MGKWVPQRICPVSSGGKTVGSRERIRDIDPSERQQLNNKLRVRRIFIIVGMEMFLISSELLAFRSLNHFSDGFPHLVGTLLQRLAVVADVVSAASKQTPHPLVTGTLKGVVRGPAGEAICNVKMRVEQWYIDQGTPHFLTEIVAFTDEKGAFSVNVPAGVYDVLVSRPDYEPVAKKLKVVSGRGTILNLQLKTSKLTEFIE